MPSDPISLARPLARFAPLFEAGERAAEQGGAAWSAAWQEPALRAIAYVGVPEAFNPYPFRLAGLGVEHCGYALHLAIVERLARAGANALLALPGASLSTSAVLKLGSVAQIARFFAPYPLRPCWSFFAVTEAEIGSDATRIAMRLERGAEGWRLTGRKLLIGAAQIAETGLVLARHAEGEGLALVLIAERPNGGSYQVAPLATTGMSGLGLSELAFDGHSLPPDCILGAGGRMPALLALTGVFERHRPMVGAMALGTARAMLDRIESRCHGNRRLARHLATHRALRQAMSSLGRQIESGAGEGSAISLFKWQAVRFLDQVRQACLQLAPSALLEDPALRRLHRNGGAFEYMEGTSNIHRQNAFGAYLAGRATHACAS